MSLFTALAASRKGVLYCLEHPDGYVKIGWTSGPPLARLQAIQHCRATFWPNNRAGLLTLVGTIPAPKRFEQFFHAVQKPYRVHGREWYRLDSPAAAWFLSQPFTPLGMQCVEQFKSLCEDAEMGSWHSAPHIIIPAEGISIES